MQVLIHRLLSKVKRELGVDKLYVKKLLHYFKDKNGIEIGGPTAFFKDGLPIYTVVNSLDGCNFNGNTIWEGSIEKGFTYDYGSSKKGYQYISEASDLAEIATGKYDFLLASHCLEHCANALRTFKEWVRVVKAGGNILLILPDKRFTFDHNRSVTSFQHLQEDYKNNVAENDLTHLPEILSLHDLSRDLAAGDLENFKKRSLSNFENRCLHHHVFDFSLLTEILLDSNVEVVFKKFVKPYHQIIVGRKR